MDGARCFFNTQNTDAERNAFNALMELLQKCREEQAEHEERSNLAKAEARERRLKEKEQERKRIESVTSLELPMDWENPYADELTEQQELMEPDLALLHSLNTVGRVDICLISAVTGLKPADAITALGGSIYQDPELWDEQILEGWVTSDEYLSGNLAHRWRVAKAANRKYRGHFEQNVKALEALIPNAIAAEDIYVTIGSPWVPTDIIDEFIAHLVPGFKLPAYKNGDVCHDEASGIWEVPHKNRFDYTKHALKATSAYGTSRINMLEILEDTLNMRTIRVTKADAKRNKAGVLSKVAVLDRDATVLALEKQRRLVEEFERWVFSDPDRRDRLRQVYDSRYGAIRRRSFDGSFLSFKGLSPAVSLYPYQKNAVARMIFTPNTLLAHDVGSGKTLEMIAAGMEMRRMGISKKNMFLVPGSLIGQWRRVFATMYPDARVLVVSPESFRPARRQAMLTEMRDGDYDGIIIAYSCFDMIPLSRDYYENDTVERLAELERTDEKLKSGAAVKPRQRALERRLEKIKAQGEEDIVFFDRLGINTLFVDEAHNYKNVPVDTRITHTPGISTGGSTKCQGLFDKARSIQKANGGRGIILATGTPITNSITDVYVMQSFLQSGELALLGLGSFDAWIGMFAEKTTDFEIDVDTSGYRLTTRFSRFHNLPELTAILSSVADFRRASGEEGIPRLDGYTDERVPRTHDFNKYLATISKRADAVRGGKVDPADDNMLKITTDGRKAALDLRLVESKVHFTRDCKVARCAEAVARIYRDTEQDRLTQLVFCDSSTPKAGLNMYDELRRLLVEDGVKNEEIAYIHDADTEKRKNELLDRTDRGDVRVLIGSTFKLGLGVNVQSRLIALHHLDVPWRPADMVQREGRILRQGNRNPVVYIYRYVTEGSFDAYSWQLLETKQRFISQLLSGSLTERNGSDVDSTVLNYAEIKALAVGNPRVKERVQLANRLAGLLLLQRDHTEQRQRLGQERLELPAKLERIREVEKSCAADARYVAEEASPPIEDRDEAQRVRELIERGLRENSGSPLEKEITVYRGFRVICPPFMAEAAPHVYLVREGKYYVEVIWGQGLLKRIDRYLDELKDKKKAHTENKKRILARMRAIDEELDTPSGYMDEIDSIKRRLNNIDSELGVNKK